MHFILPAGIQTVILRELIRRVGIQEIGYSESELNFLQEPCFDVTNALPTDLV